MVTSCSNQDNSYEGWLGKWAGPEGTYLDIKRNENSYQLTIADLDGPKTFKGQPGLDGISFTRNGLKELVSSGTGSQTGMKWLADKKNCLIIRTGEGFCRN